jgi:hypothetical protein
LTKINATFSPDNTLVSYKVFSNYSFVGSQTTGDVETDLVCGVNAGFLASLAQGDGTEQSFLLALVPLLASNLQNQLTSSIVSLMTPTLNTTVPSQACVSATSPGIPYAFASVVLGVTAQVGPPLAAIADSSQAGSFAAQFTATAISQLPATVLATVLNANPNIGVNSSPVLYLPVLFVDVFPALWLYGAAGSTVAGVLSGPDQTAFSQFTLADNRWILCLASLSTPSVCSMRVSAGVSSAATNAASISGAGLLTFNAVYSGALANLNASFGPLYSVDDIGGLQFTTLIPNMGPLLIPAAAATGYGLPGAIAKPLEYGAVPSVPALSASAATLKLLSLTCGCLPSRLLVRLTRCPQALSVRQPGVHHLDPRQHLLNLPPNMAVHRVRHASAARFCHQ